MRNEKLAELDVLVGDWTFSLFNAWFLESMETTQHGTAQCSWLGEAFIRLTADIDGEPTWDFVFGGDARGGLQVLYHDPRGVLRRFDATFDAATGELRLERADPDMHQDFVLRISGDGNRIDAETNASDDAGVTWRKDFDLVFERA